MPIATDALFQVEIANQDVREVVWERNGILIHGGDGKYDVTVTGKSSSLTIRTVTKQDEAAYCCKVGSTTTVARLYVEGKIYVLRKVLD